MVEAVEAAKGKKDLQAGDLIRTVNAIIDYQTGKEKGFFSSEKNQLFNDSMAMLGELMVGTEAGRFCPTQAGAGEGTGTGTEKREPGSDQGTDQAHGHGRICGV